MKVLLTGATGFLGNNLLRILNERDSEVIVAGRFREPPPSLQGLRFEAVQLDLARPDSWSGRELPRFDVCIHSAALIQIGWSRLEEARMINVEATRRLASVCRQRGARMVFVSTINTLACSRDGRVLGEQDRQPACPPICYVTTKREAEQAIGEETALGLDAVTVHPSFMLGPWDWRPSSAEMMIAIARQRPPFAPGGGTCVADVRDVAEGILLAAGRGQCGDHYILGGPNLSYFELWSRMADAMGVRRPRFRLPDWMALAGGRTGDLWSAIRRQEGSLNSGAARMGQLFHYYSSQRAVDALGYAFRPVDEALEQTARWIVDRGWVRAKRRGRSGP